MEQLPIEGRVSALEKDVVDVHNHLQRHDEQLAVHDQRITTHGRENDEIREEQIRKDVEAKHTREQLARIENEQREQKGMLTTITQKPAEKWDRAVWVIVTAVLSSLVGFFLARMGLR